MSARRSTLASIDAPNTGIPAPSSAMKAIKYVSSNGNAQPTLSHRTSRQSLAPQRQSTTATNNATAEDAAVAGSSKISSTPAAHRMSRQSVMGTASTSTGGRTSTMGSSVGATPNDRRSMGARQSLAPNAFSLPSTAMKPPTITDPRPLRSKEFVQEMKNRVFEYAEVTGFAMFGYKGMSSLDTPTQALFICLFKHIFNNAIDPHYQFSTEAKKPEDELWGVMMEYRYPALGDITKMLLSSASSQQSWPKALAILDWMVSLSRSASHVPPGPLQREVAHNDHVSVLVRNHSDALTKLHQAPKTTSADEQKTLQARADAAGEELREAEHGGDSGAEAERWFFPFMWKCYEKFWQGEDQFPDELAELEKFFLSKNASVKSEVARLEIEKAKLEAELSELTSQDSPLAKAEGDNEVLRGDIAKFTQYKDEILIPKVHKTKVTIGRLQESQSESEMDLERLRREHDALSEQVSTQEMSSEEFDRLSNNRSNLMSEKAKVEDDIKDHDERRYNLEVVNANLQQKLEEKLKTFNEIGGKVEGFFPLKVPRANGRGEEYLDEIELLLGQSTLIHPGINLKVDLQAKMQSLRDECKRTLAKLTGDHVDAQEKLDQVEETLERVKSEHTEVKNRLEITRESIDSLGKVTEEETHSFNADQVSKERKVELTQQGGHRQLIEAESRLAELRTHQKHLKALVADSLEKYKDELCAAVEECMDLKARVEESMEEVGITLGVDVRKVLEGLGGPADGDVEGQEAAGEDGREQEGYDDSQGPQEDISMDS